MENFKTPFIIPNVPTNVPTNVPLNVPLNDPVESDSLFNELLSLIASNGKITSYEAAARLRKSVKTVNRATKRLQEEGKIKRVGSKKTGHWQIVNNGDDVTNRVTNDVTNDVTNPNQLFGIRKDVYFLITEDKKISISKIARKLGKSTRTIKKTIKDLQELD